MSMLPGWPGEPVTVIRPALVPDPYSGEATEVDWSSATETTYQASAVAPAGSSEPLTDGRDTVRTGTVVYLGADADVRATDRMRVRGVIHAIAGEPSLWVDPWTQTPSGLVITLVRVDG